MKTFLKPLTPEEELFYLKRYQAGSLEAKHVLIEHNLRLVAHIAKKYQNDGEDNEDLISIGTIGLIKAVSTFNPDKGSRLGTYAARCIDNELLMMLRSRKKTSREFSIDEPIGNDSDGNEIHLLDLLESHDPDIVEQITLCENVRLLYRYFRSALNSREQKVISMRYGLFEEQEQTQKEIAAKLGISRSYVSRIEKRSLAKLEACFRHNKNT